MRSFYTSHHCIVLSLLLLSSLKFEFNEPVISWSNYELRSDIAKCVGWCLYFALPLSSKCTVFYSLVAPKKHCFSFDRDQKLHIHFVCWQGPCVLIQSKHTVVTRMLLHVPTILGQLVFHRTSSSQATQLHQVFCACAVTCRGQAKVHVHFKIAFESFFAGHPSNEFRRYTSVGFSSLDGHNWMPFTSAISLNTEQEVKYKAPPRLGPVMAQDSIRSVGLGDHFSLVPP